MSDASHIEWTDATWQPITGCTILSPGCINCYAMTLAAGRLRHHPSRKGLTKSSKAGPVWTGEVRFNQQWLDQPLRWREPRMIFVCAHGDLFHESVPDVWIDRVFDVMGRCPQHTFQVLTKRAARMRAYLADPETPNRQARINALVIAGFDAAACKRLGVTWNKLKRWPLPNVWLGVSAERQQEADERIPLLLQTPAAVRFVSAEPLLGPINLAQAGLEVSLNGLDDAVTTNLHWIIVGGESGKNARPMHPDWPRSLRDQCMAAGVSFFFKQWGEFRPCRAPVLEWSEPDGLKDVPITVMPDGGTPELGTQTDKQLRRAVLGNNCAPMARVGKAKAGRLLDGKEHNEFPSSGVAA